jgi:hypothetical protein
MIVDLEKREQYRKQYRLDNKEKRKEYIKEYRKKNKVKIKEDTKDYYKKYSLENKEKIKEKNKIYREKNKEHIKEHNKEYREKNKEKISENSKNYYKNNKEVINKKIVKNNNSRKKIDALYKLRCSISSLISTSIKKQGYTKKSRTHQIIGCSYEEFKKHLERQFTIGMTWENYGKWHLDHIYPVSLAKDEDDLMKLNHYTNFQPLWALENIKKRNKVIANTQIKLI